MFWDTKASKRNWYRRRPPTPPWYNITHKKTEFRRKKNRISQNFAEKNRISQNFTEPLLLGVLQYFTKKNRISQKKTEFRKPKKIRSSSRAIWNFWGRSGTYRQILLQGVVLGPPSGSCFGLFRGRSGIGWERLGVILATTAAVVAQVSEATFGNFQRWSHVLSGRARTVSVWFSPDMFGSSNWCYCKAPLKGIVFTTNFMQGLLLVCRLGFFPEPRKIRSSKIKSMHAPS